MKELKIGEIGEINGKKVICRNFTDRCCNHCVFHDKSVDGCLNFYYVCDNSERTDGKIVYFDELKGTDIVNHPTHYTWLKEKTGVEVIDITRHLDFDLGNAVKYILRAGHKTEQGYTEKQKQREDLQKAIWYINDFIEQNLREK